MSDKPLSSMIKSVHVTRGDGFTRTRIKLTEEGKRRLTTTAVSIPSTKPKRDWLDRLLGWLARD